MKALALAVTALFVLAAPVQQARASVDVSIDFFYDAMQPYGDWIYINGYGYCWQPGVDVVGVDWQPYTDGYWAYTDAGWTWISNEPFGWATYHYGRWMINAGSWCWVPGYEWAPAWVSWRQTSNHIGWAPLPPEASWSAGVGFSTWTDSYYGIGPDYYSFVPFSSFACHTSLRPYVVDRHHNLAFMSLSVNITNIRYQSNVVNHIFVGGPDVSRIDRFGGGQVARYHLRHDDERMRSDWLGGGSRDPRSLSRIDRDQLIVASPAVRRDERPGIPSRVRASYSKPEVNHGWRSAGRSDQGSTLRSRHEQEARALPANLPGRTPTIATSSTPPPAVGRNLSSTERRGSPVGSSSSSVGKTEEVRRATPMGTTDRAPSTRPTVTSSDPRSRFSGPSSVPAPGDQRPSYSPRPSTPSASPPSSSRPSMPQARPSFTPRPSTPSVPPPSSSRPSIPQSRPSFTPRPSAPSVTPPSSSRPSIPQSRPSYTPRPSTPSASPPSSSRPSMPQARPSFTPRPSTPSVTPPSSSRPSMPQARPSFTPRPSSAPVSPPQGTRPSFGGSRGTDPRGSHRDSGKR